MRLKNLTLSLSCLGAVALSYSLGLGQVFGKETVETAKLAALRVHARDLDTAKDPAPLKLKGHDARQQLLVTGIADNGKLRDLTHQVKFESKPEGIVKIDPNGVVIPVQDGAATVTAKSSEGLLGSLQVTVENSKEMNPVNFPNQIVPIFTKGGCNGGGCHGKSSGQNGFKLSLLGFEPTEDYEYLVREARGRRIFPASPDRSLLLLKGAAILPHGGGKRIEPDSDDYKLLVRWINQGMPYGKTNDPTVARVEVFPKERTMGLGADQQLVVLAHYTDGSTEDVTRSALFEPNDKNMAKTDPNGRVTVFDQPGDVAVMVRYQAKVAVFRATLPLGAPVDKVPVSKNFIDDLVFKKLKTMGMPPSEIADDATFLRRSSIDIAGRLPTPAETKKFMEDKDPKKRDNWVAMLVDSPEYADYFANKWNALLRNKRGDGTHMRGNYAFHDWIRDSLLANKPYDQFVRDIVAASGDMAQNPPVAWYRQVNSPNTQLEDTAQLFLGLRLQCAQCHHHPFEKWSQDDYYSLSAFFSRVNRKAGSQPGEEVIFHRRGMASAVNKKTKLPLQPAALGTKTPQLSPDDDPRQALADWMSNKDNPFFAKSLVNRYWKHFFNRGLVDPEDDMRETNPPTNPELLDSLAHYFVESGFDLKQLVKTICQSQVYQLSSIPNEHNKIDKHNYSRYYPKRLTAEVLFDAVNVALKAESRFDGLPADIKAVQLPDNSFNASSYFLTVFGRPDSSSSCECERSQDASLAQSLHLLNAKDIQDKLASNTGRAALMAGDTKRSDEDKIRDLYALVYSRAPEPRDIELAKSYLEKKTKAADASKPEALVAAKRQSYEDILWALINTKEFLFNH